MNTIKVAQDLSTLTEPALLLAGLLAVVGIFWKVVNALVKAFMVEHSRLVEQYAALVEQARLERLDCTAKREALHADRKTEIAALSKTMEESVNSRAQIGFCISANTAQSAEVAKVLALVKDKLEKIA